MNDFLMEKHSIKDAIRKLEALKIILIPIIDKNKNVIGTITDGDIRRGLLQGKTLTDKVKFIMNKNPIIGIVSNSEQEIFKYMKKKGVNAIPVVDKNGIYKYVLNFYAHNKGVFINKNHKKISIALIMAGGEGKRLFPITKKIPKPLVNIGGESILLKTIKKLLKSGVEEIFISVNYLSDKIEDYIKDQHDLKAKITFLKEETKGGTAGSISLLPKDLRGPILVLNGDLLFETDIDNLTNYHFETNAQVTIGVVNYKFDIPFGVVNFSDDKVLEIEEKPTKNFFCSAGIYIIDTGVMNLNDSFRQLDMPNYLMKLISLNKKIVGFPIHEYWSDIGTKIDLKKARSKYGF